MRRFGRHRFETLGSDATFLQYLPARSQLNGRLNEVKTQVYSADEWSVDELYHRIRQMHRLFPRSMVQNAPAILPP
jgi:hypothetical protein